MSRRKFSPLDFGFTEAEWAALSEDRKLHFRNRAHYIRNKEKRQRYQREYNRRKKEKAREQTPKRHEQGRKGRPHRS